MTTTTQPYTVETTDDGQPIQANTVPWLLRRQTLIGSSEGPAILGLSRWSSPRDVAIGKRLDAISDEQNEAMEFGHLMEPVAIELFRRRHGDPENSRHRYLGQVQPPPGLIRSTAYPWLGASLDVVIVEPDGYEAHGQIKNVTTFKRGAWADSEGGVPDDVRVQVLQECIVKGTDHGYVLPIFGGNTMPEPIRVDLDPAFADWYLGYSRDWWEKYGPDSSELPDPTLLDDLNDIWTGVMGSSIDLPAELVERVLEHKALGQTIKSLTEQRDAIALEVKTFLGDHTEGWDRRDPAKPRLAVTWRPNRESAPVRRLDEAQLRADHPELGDLLDGYTETLPGKRAARPFLSK